MSILSFCTIVALCLAFVHSSLSQYTYPGPEGFTEEPSSVVQAQGLKAVFKCHYPYSIRVYYAWLLNGMVVYSSSSLQGPPQLFVVTALPEHDNATIQCQVASKYLYEWSRIATLRVQGPLDPVTNLVFDTTLLSSTSITISWTAPFSLGLTTAEPDIQYCVDVYNVTGGEDNHIHSECSITVTSYTFPASDPDQLFNFTVTPRSNVEGSLNGTTSQSVQGFVCRGPTPLGNLLFVGIVAANDMLNATVEYDSTATQNQDVGQECPITITLTNTISEEGPLCRLVPQRNFLSGHSIAHINKETCSGVHRHNLLTLMFDGGKKINISTHDVQNPRVNSTHVSCDYLENTRDLGVFVILKYGDNFHYRLRERNGEASTTIPLYGLERGSYEVSVYDLERGPKPNQHSAALPIHVNISNTTDQNPVLNSTRFDRKPIITGPEGGKICLSCPFSSTDLTHCVGVFHSAQFKDRTLIVLSVELNAGSSCNDSLTGGDYKYAVFGLSDQGLQETPGFTSSVTVDQPTKPTTVMSSTVDNTEGRDQEVVAIAVGVGTLAAICLVFIVIVTVILCVLYKRRKQEHVKTQENEANSLAPKVNEAYETAGQPLTEPCDDEEINLLQVGQ